MSPKNAPARWISSLHGKPASLFDLLLGLGVTGTIAVVISADQGGGLSPDALAYVFAALFGALMLVRRRFPVGVLLATMLLLFAYYSLDYPAIGLAAPVAAALYSAAEQGRVPAAIGVSAILLIVSTYFRLVEGQSVAFLLGYELVSSLALMVAAIALGAAMRALSALRSQQEQTARLIAQEHAWRAEQRVQDERVRIARDLHDLIGHSISVIAIHANVAREAIGRDDAQARQALGHIQAASTATLRELRATVKLLRTPASTAVERSPATLANLPLLVENATAGGLEVRVQRSGPLDDLPATVDAAAYRILQESLTNVLRHARATQVCLEVHNDGQALHLHVADDGEAGREQAALTGAGAAPLMPGNGIAGMVERARLLGGTLTAAPGPHGFEVTAMLPVNTLPLKETP